MEFLVGLLCLLLGTMGTFAAIRRRGMAIRVAFWAAVGLDLAVLSTLFMDWGYLVVERTALSIALQSNIWIAIPHALVVLSFAALLTWGRGAVPWIVLIKGLQAVSFLPVFILVGMDTDTSFLAFSPLFAVYASVLAAFWYIPEAASVIPTLGDHWYPVAFGPRTHLIEAISELRTIGLSSSDPVTVFESGSAQGRVGDTDCFLETFPSLFPPAYALRILWTRPEPVNEGVPASPGFALREKFTVHGRTIEYVGKSAGSFRISNESLQSFLMSVAVPSG